MRNTYSYKIRATAFVVAILLVISIFIADLFRIQVINADEYASKNIYLSSATTKIDALRGEILDTNGTPLVYNESSNTVYIDASYFPKASNVEERNEIILSLIKLIVIVQIIKTKQLRNLCKKLLMMKNLQKNMVI